MESTAVATQSESPYCTHRARRIFIFVINTRGRPGGLYACVCVCVSQLDSTTTITRLYFCTLIFFFFFFICLSRSVVRIHSADDRPRRLFLSALKHTHTETKSYEKTEILFIFFAYFYFPFSARRRDTHAYNNART